MATILALPPRCEKYQTKPRGLGSTAVARVIIFPGVRYERIPEATIKFAKSGKKTLKIA